MPPHHGPRVWLLGYALAPALLLSACTSDDGSGSSPTASSSPTAHSTAEKGEKKLAAEARSALDATAGDGSMVESGVERVTEGIHTQPALDKRTTYRLTVVCAGKGEAQIVFTPASAGSKETVPCDGSADFERFTATDSLRLDVQGKPGATGMIAWRINQM
jgi:hypothetical protein